MSINIKQLFCLVPGTQSLLRKPWGPQTDKQDTFLEHSVGRCEPGAGAQNTGPHEAGEDSLGVL